MFKTIKSGHLIVGTLLVLIIFSCVDPVETPSRTAATEQAELSEILANIHEEGYDLDTTDLGIYYIVHQEGEGDYPSEGDTCFMQYVGYRPDGSVFDASAYHYEDSIWQFVYKEVSLIPGFDDGISVMNKGSEIDMIIPSEHAYGEYGAGLIEPYTTLMFAAKMHDIKPAQ